MRGVQLIVKLGFLRLDSEFECKTGPTERQYDQSATCKALRLSNGRNRETIEAYPGQLGKSSPDFLGMRTWKMPTNW